LRERPSGAAVVASLAALAGVVVMVGWGAEGSLGGDALALAMALAMGAMILIARRHPGIPALPATCVASALGALAVLPFATFGIGGADMALLMAFALVNQVLGFGAFAVGVRHLPPMQSALVTALDAPLAPLWVWLVFAETPSAATLLGGAIVMLAVLGHILRDARA
jgi:drug/metabolite transporter (DMT)-like permease